MSIPKFKIEVFFYIFFCKLIFSEIIIFEFKDLQSKYKETVSRYHALKSASQFSTRLVQPNEFKKQNIEELFSLPNVEKREKNLNGEHKRKLLFFKQKRILKEKIP